MQQLQSTPASPAAASGNHSPAPNRTGIVAQEFVGERRERMSDEEREDAIRRAGKAIEHHMALYAANSDFMDRGDADRARLLMQRLIAGRSAEQVARMERERGLA